MTNIKLNHQYRMLELELRKSKITPKPAPMVNETASGMPRQVVSDYRTQGINPENPFVASGSAPFPEPELTDHQEAGKQELHTLVTFWMENFREDGKEQPDRNHYMQELGYDGKRAGSIISYSMKVGGLTKVLWNIFWSKVGIWMLR